MSIEFERENVEKKKRKQSKESKVTVSSTEAQVTIKFPEQRTVASTVKNFKKWQLFHIFGILFTNILSIPSPHLLESC